MALPNRAEIAAALKGLALLLRGDARALQFYDLSLDGFWRSFGLPLFCLAVYLILQPVNPVQAEIWADNRLGFLLMQGLEYLLAWAAFLVAMAAISRGFGLGHRYAVFVVLYNWAQAIVTAASLPILAGSLIGLLPLGMLAGWSTGILLLWLYIVLQAGRIGLGASLSLAVGAAFLDLAISLLVHRLFDLVS
ncbi:MAG: hypothetical protein ACK4GK_08240 [Ferrovibrio sp.]